MLSSVLDCLDVAVVLTDDSRDHIRFANRAFLRLVGCSAAELADDHKSLQDLVDPVDREREAPQRALLAQGKIDGYTIRKRYLRADGSRVWANVTLRALPGNGADGESVVRTIEPVAQDDGAWRDGRPPVSSIVVGEAVSDGFAPLVAMRDSDDVPPAIRAAIQLITDNSGGRLGLSEVARRCGTSVRSLQRHFARHGMSAARVLKLMRLRRARALLGGSEAASSVTGVAFACGFTNLGHFARDYRAAFGELPSATLGRARIDERAGVSRAECA
ncbi:helix-turn-helix domain-containing protein [Bradyrhizobium sp. U87765 SZCCT0131]|nr:MULTISPECIES: helix-turn-helix domain-containing protein [unclassified Bradyrhizobium]MBR1219135.1 helix-turn-helix domain-containing protein [Bradyrhizobium sp. U87765 SZCCT0131]MBR1261786.1 helix-turn-helix domain-containing protein [Bradyrhizobium sp. U87765 SZCCT0134]MBR1306361.1 helix-turn-helix domain-containing protein [Bradyrhizobium sp. U87765 SZCCT0110]MBR1317568.1 helix-turn-helix domain-containing protein [Bradyrhizobium sp. U87765 SZCCT0109]MBR1351270.1 helix-turn-helix domain-